MNLIDRDKLIEELRSRKIYYYVSSTGKEEEGFNDGIDLAISIISDFPFLTLKQIEHEWKYMNTLEGVIKELEEMTYNPNEADYENQGYYLARDSLYYLKKYKQIINESK